jgi:hypothetical protein
VFSLIPARSGTLWLILRFSGTGFAACPLLLLLLLLLYVLYTKNFVAQGEIYSEYFFTFMSEEDFTSLPLEAKIGHKVSHKHHQHPLFPLIVLESSLTRLRAIAKTI